MSSSILRPVEDTTPRPYADVLAPGAGARALRAAVVDLVLGRVRGDAPSDIMVSGEISLIGRESTAPPPGHAS